MQTIKVYNVLFTNMALENNSQPSDKKIMYEKCLLVKLQNI